jgi:iron complex outermembrane receptor protein
VYVDVEGDVLKQLRIGVAGRYENFSDFGGTTNGKLTMRYSPAKPIIFRAAASTGFRAPSLSQAWFSTVSTNFLPNPVTGVIEPFEVGNYPVTSAIAVALGAKPLRPETSHNYSGGVVWQPMSTLELTADFFHIDIKHRIVFSGNFTGPKVQALLAPFGVNGARFFTNAIDTRTNGYDLVTNYQHPLFAGRIDLSAAYSNNKTKIVGTVATPPQLAGLEETLFDRRERRRYECAQPHDNIRLMESYNQGPFLVTARQSRFGDFCSMTINAVDDQIYASRWVSDLDFSYRWSRYVFAVGAENLFDTFPTRNKNRTAEQSGAGGIFPYPNNNPFGVSGRFVYSRISIRF